MDFQSVAHLGRDFGPVRPVLIGQYDLFDTKARGRQNFFFNATDSHHSAAETNLAGHGNIRADAAPREQRGQGGHDRHTGAWAVFGCRSGRHMDMKIELLIIRKINA